MLMTHQAPSFLGGWCLVGIVAASMSTASGAILAMGTVFSHNLMRQLDPIKPDLITDDNLLQMARIATIPMAAISGFVAVYSGKTGYVSLTQMINLSLQISFDIVCRELTDCGVVC
jgi:solute:Na+ symporter, SSS family